MKKAIGGFVVVFDVSEEVELVMQDSDQSFGPGAAKSADGHTLFDLVGQLIKLSDIAIYIEPRIGKFTDQKGQFLRTVAVRPQSR